MSRLATKAPGASSQQRKAAQVLDAVIERAADVLSLPMRSPFLGSIFTGKESVDQAPDDQVGFFVEWELTMI